jgi:hypothetical protein
VRFQADDRWHTIGDVRRSSSAARALLVLWASLGTACPRPSEAELPTTGLVSLLVVRAPRSSGAPAEVEAIPPSRLERSWVLPWSEGERVVLLAYDRPLADLGLVLDERGQLVTRAGGVPLPPPTAGYELDGGELIPFTERLEVSFPELRVPDAPCATLVEDRDLRVVPEPGREVAFALALDEVRTLIVYESKPSTNGAPGAVVVTATASRPLDWRIAPTRSGPRGFVERDGRAWITAMIHTDTGTTPALCHVDAHSALDAGSCRPARGDTGGFPFEAVAGWRAVGDDDIELVALNEAGDLYHRRGATPSDGAWALHSRGRLDERLPCEALPVSTLAMDGPGTGVVASPRSELARFDLAGGRREVIFAGASCRTAYGRHPDGAQVLVRNESIVQGFGTFPPSDVYMRRGDTAPWTRVETDVELDARRVVVLDHLLLVTAASNTMSAVVFEPGRPDVTPRVCRAVPVANSGAWSSLGVDGRVLVAGRVPEVGDLLPRALGRWRLAFD